MPAKRARDVERVYSTKEFVAKLRRLADAVESGQAFEIQVAGERLHVPADAHLSIEHERVGTMEEVEFQVRWQRG
jgi:amphi-Trp domain-containing protein